MTNDEFVSSRLDGFIAGSGKFPTKAVIEDAARPSFFVFLNTALVPRSFLISVQSPFARSPTVVVRCADLDHTLWIREHKGLGEFGAV